ASQKYGQPTSIRQRHACIASSLRHSPRRSARYRYLTCRCCIGEREFGGPETARPRLPFWPKQSPQRPECRRQSLPIAGYLPTSERLPNSNECVVGPGGLEPPTRPL